jgi:hypothetical protein
MHASESRAPPLRAPTVASQTERSLTPASPTIHPSWRQVSFEEQATVLRENLAEVLEKEEEWSQAAQTLAGIDLDSGGVVVVGFSRNHAAQALGGSRGCSWESISRDKRALGQECRAKGALRHIGPSSAMCSCRRPLQPHSGALEPCSANARY